MPTTTVRYPYRVYADALCQEVARPDRHRLPGRDSGSSPMNLIKSKRRVADHGEVFTWLVESMLDLVKGETERIDSRFLANWPL